MTTKALGKAFTVRDGKLVKLNITRDLSHKIRQKKSQKVTVQRRIKQGRRS
jgi:hypothetical protein